jgi:hypothetical protein
MKILKHFARGLAKLVGYTYIKQTVQKNGSISANKERTYFTFNNYFFIS